MLFFNPTFEWNFFFKHIDIRKKSKSKILIVVNEELNLESLSVIEHIMSCSQKTVKVRSISNNAFENKVYDSYFKSKISAVEKQSRFYFLLSTNTRLESAILNVKLRARFLAKNILIMSIGLNFDSNLPVEYINLNGSEVLTFFEGKNTKLSKLFLISKSPLFLFGSSFKNRFIKFNLLLLHLKDYMPSSILFLLEENCNSAGLRLMNIKSLNAKDFINSEILISINLEESLFAGAINTLKTSESFWFNSYVPEIALKYDMIVPINSHYEIGGTFLNLENRPQNAVKLDTNMNTLKSISSVFTAIKNNTINSSLFLRYVKENAENAKYFNVLENRFTNLYNTTNQNSIMKIDLYPSKASVEDYYTKNSSCKKSLTMINRSQETRSFLNNFL
jgi:hypothetical protein